MEMPKEKIVSNLSISNDPVWIQDFVNKRTKWRCHLCKTLCGVQSSHSKCGSVLCCSVKYEVHELPSKTSRDNPVYGHPNMESVPVEEATAGCEIYQCQEEILNNGTHTNCKSVISLVNYQPFKIFACDVNIWKGHVGKTIDGQGKFKVIKGFWAMFSCFPCDVQIRLLLKFYKIMLNVLQIKRDYCDSVLSTKARRRYLARGFTRTIIITKRLLAWLVG